MSEFIEKLRKDGKIKPLSEAFRKYPPEEEIHKGDPEFFFKVKKEGQYNTKDSIKVKLS